MTQKKKFLGVLLILAIYVAIAIVGFLIIFGIKSYITGQKENAKPSATAPTPAPPVAGYKIYQSKQQKFSISYPTKLQPKENSYGMGISTVELRSNDNTDPSDAPDIQIMSFPKTLAATIGQSFDTYYALRDNTTKIVKSPLGNNGSAAAFTKVHNREVNGHHAFDYTSVPSPNPDNQNAEIGVFIEIGSDVVIIATDNSNKDDLEAMLKTFKYPL